MAIIFDNEVFVAQSDIVVFNSTSSHNCVAVRAVENTLVFEPKSNTNKDENEANPIIRFRETINITIVRGSSDSFTLNNLAEGYNSGKNVTDTLSISDTAAGTITDPGDVFASITELLILTSVGDFNPPSNWLHCYRGHGFTIPQLNTTYYYAGEIQNYPYYLSENSDYYLDHIPAQAFISSVSNSYDFYDFVTPGYDLNGAWDFEPINNSFCKSGDKFFRMVVDSLTTWCIYAGDEKWFTATLNFTSRPDAATTWTKTFFAPGGTIEGYVNSNFTTFDAISELLGDVYDSWNNEPFGVIEKI